MDKLKTIDFKETKTFDCGGVTWTVSNQISFKRFRKLQELLIEFGFSATVKDIFIGLNKSWEYLNKLKLAEASVIIHNLMNGVKDMEVKTDISLRICALFINKEGEDLSDDSDALIEGKVNAWNKELDAAPFFHFAANLSRDWIAAYNVFTRSTSEVAAKSEVESSTMK